MAYEFRAIRDYVIGVLGTGLTISGTTLQSTAFTTLPNSYYSSSIVLPLCLHDPATGFEEEVWVTAHTGSANTVTIERGKNGTTARAWQANTQVVCAPTTRDGLPVLTRATLPSDAHVGMRVALSDESIVVQKTRTGGWQASVGVAVPGDFGRRIDGSVIPNTSTIIMRAGRATGTTDSSGRITASFEAPFPNQCLRVVPVWVSGSSGSYVLGIDAGVPATASAFTIFLYSPSTGLSAGAGINVTFDYIATGY